MKTRSIGRFALKISVLCDVISPLVFGFSSLILASSVIKKRRAIFKFEYFLSVFGTGMIFFKSLEEVISLGKCQKEV